jgi:hypothetical protein
MRPSLEEKLKRSLSSIILHKLVELAFDILFIHISPISRRVQREIPKGIAITMYPKERESESVSYAYYN